MLGLDFGLPQGKPPSLLFIGAHCDDIEIGCGGSVIELLKGYPEATVHWVVLSSNSVRSAEARKAARLMLRGTSNGEVIVKDFRDCIFPSQLVELKSFVEELKRSISPDLIFSHFRDDLHQDHRVVGELVWNSFRDHMILEYEVPKYDGGLGSPSVFVPLSAAAVKRKVDLLMREFPSQLSRSWFTAETFMALMRLRGIECNAPSGYAEAFYCRKLILHPSPVDKSIGRGAKQSGGKRVTP